jgi:hypothetical protein
MTYKKKLQILCVLLFSVIVFVGCDDSSSSSDDDSITIQVSVTGSVYNSVYFDLESESSLDESEAASQNWDLRFQASTKVCTNSGSTATEESSNGQGGVVLYSNQASASELDFTGTYNTDVEKYVSGHGTTAYNFNTMSFPGYESGTGTTGDPFSSAAMDQAQFYTYDGMPPVYEMTGQEYVIRHGDGTSYSKLEFLAIEYSTETLSDNSTKKTTYYFKIKISPLF